MPAADAWYGKIVVLEPDAHLLDDLSWPDTSILSHSLRRYCERQPGMRVVIQMSWLGVVP